jgi:hypothetical protein
LETVGSATDPPRDHGSGRAGPSGQRRAVSLDALAGGFRR